MRVAKKPGTARVVARASRTPWAATTLLDLQLGQHLWREALTTVEAAIRIVAPAEPGTQREERRR